MSRPKRKPDYNNNKKTEHRFINPYTFIPVYNRTEERPSAEDSVNSSDRLLTGVLKCHLHTKTPIIIPDTAQRSPDPEIKDHYHYPFMKINGKYAIPGSSIRGPVRNMYETLTDSCFSTMKDHQMITARTKAPFKAGVLFIRGNDLILVKATRFRIAIKYKPGKTLFSKKDLMDYGYGACLRFKGSSSILRNTITVYDVDEILETIDNISEITRQDIATEEKVGFLFIGEMIGGKSYESIFLCESIPTAEDDSSTFKDGITENVKGAYLKLRNTVEEYQNETVNRNLKINHRGYTHIDFDGFENGSIPALPVWYSGEGAFLHFSTANIGRFTYNRTLNEIVPEQSRPCSNITKACKACSLFGMIRKGNSDNAEDNYEGSGSHVRFSDATLLNTYSESDINEFEECIPLEELSSPKPSYLPFYLRASNYKNGYDDPSAEIKGRKYYWHHKPNLDKDYRDKIDRSSRNATMQILMDPVVFEFSVYFEGINETQFRELKCALTLGENKKDGDLCYKIGHGKPLGFGSAKITVESSSIREYDNGSYNVDTKKETEISVESIEDVFTEWPDGLKDIVDISFGERVTDFASDGVRYPYVVNGTKATKERVDKESPNALASHKWFSKNYSLGMDKPQYALKIPADYKSDDMQKDLSSIALPAFWELIDIKDENGKSVFAVENTHTEKESVNEGNNQEDSYTNRLEIGQVIKVKIQDLSLDNHNLRCGGFHYRGKRGSVKNLSGTVKINDEVKAVIVDIKNKKISAEYTE